MTNQARILNKLTNEIKTIALQGGGNLERNLLANYLDPEEWIEIPNDDKEYIYTEIEPFFIIKPIDLEKFRLEANNINTQKHEQFQQQLFTININRDNLSTLELLLNCTDNTSDNVLRAYLVAEKTGDAPFYDALGAGSDLRFSFTEMQQVYDQFQARLKPSFDVKGTTKLAINNAATVEEIQQILDNLIY